MEVRSRTEKSPPAERWLVELLLKHPEIGGRLEIPLGLFSDSRLSRVASAAVEYAGAAEGEFVPAVVAAARDPEAETLVTELSMEPGQWADPERAARDCIARILEAALRRRMVDWQSRLDEAKRRGNAEQIQSLLKEGEALRKEKVGLLQKAMQPEGILEASPSG